MSKSICADISNSFRRCITNPGFIESLEQDNYKLLKYFIEEHKKTHELFSNALTLSQDEDKIVKLYAVSYRLEVLIFFALKEIGGRDEDVFDTLGNTFSTAAPGVRRFLEILTLRRNEFPEDLTLSKEFFIKTRGYTVYQMLGVNIFPYIDHYSPAIEKGKYVPGEIINYTADSDIELRNKILSINIETELYRLYDDIHYLLKFLSLNYTLRLENKWSNENVIANIYKHEISGPPKFIAYSRKENEDDNIHIYKYEISGLPEFKENEDDNIHMYNVYFADSFKSLANIYNRDSKHEVLACKSLSIMDVVIKMYYHLVFPKLLGELTPELVSLYLKLYEEQMKNLKNSENIAIYAEYVKYMKKRNDIKFIFIRHIINTENENHANLIVYNKSENEIEIFDPTNSEKKYVDTYLKKIYSPEALNKLFGTSNIRYYYIPFQNVQSMEYASNISGTGTCASWTSWFTEQRLKYYEYPVHEVINIILNSEFAPRVSFLITRSPTTAGHTGRYFTELISSYITHIHRHLPYIIRTIFTLFKERGKEKGKKTPLDKMSINIIGQVIDKLLKESYTNVLDMYRDIIIIDKNLSMVTSLEKDEIEYNIGKIIFRLLRFLESVSYDDIVNGYSEPTKFKAPLSTYYTGYMSAPSYTHVNPYSKYVDSGVRK